LQGEHEFIPSKLLVKGFAYGSVGFPVFHGLAENLIGAAGSPVDVFIIGRRIVGVNQKGGKPAGMKGPIDFRSMKPGPGTITA
jgi:hypothetical protein